MRIIFSAGGTGGHLYPALALADYIETVDPKTEILFVGSKHRIEATKVPEYNYEFVGLDIKTPSGSVMRKIKGYYDVFSNIKKCEKMIKDFNPDIVIGFGGYTSYSIMRAAINNNIPTVLHEQNSIIGKSNQVLGRKVDALVTAYDDIKNQVENEHIYNLGNPTSYHVMQSHAANLEDYGLDPNLKTVLVVMGSQGSQTIDNVMNQLLSEIGEIDYQIIYISGSSYYEKHLDYDYGPNIKIIGYENKLTSLIQASDLIVSRSGASALTEIITANKPSILIPSIHVTNNHQYYNSLSLVESGASVLCEENDQLLLNLSVTMDSLIHDSMKLEEMVENTKKYNYQDSAKNIYQIMKQIVGEKNGK